MFLYSTLFLFRKIVISPPSPRAAIKMASLTPIGGSWPMPGIWVKRVMRKQPMKTITKALNFGRLLIASIFVIPDLVAIPSPIRQIDTASPAMRRSSKKPTNRIDAGKVTFVSRNALNKTSRQIFNRNALPKHRQNSERQAAFAFSISSGKKPTPIKESSKHKAKVLAGGFFSLAHFLNSWAATLLSPSGSLSFNRPV